MKSCYHSHSYMSSVIIALQNVDNICLLLHSAVAQKAHVPAVDLGLPSVVHLPLYNVANNFLLLELVSVSVFLCSHKSKEKKQTLLLLLCIDDGVK